MGNLRRLSSTISRRSSVAMGAAIGTALSRADSLLYTPYKWMIDSLLDDAEGDAPLLRLQSFRPTQPRKLLECKVCAGVCLLYAQRSGNGIVEPCLLFVMCVHAYRP